MASYYHSADLAATCNALGTVDPITQKYLCDTDENTIATVKDLIRYLRRDNEAHEIRRQLGASAIVQTNLIPLLKLKWENGELFDVLLRLVGNLTSPVLLLYNEEIPTDKIVRNHFLQMLGHLQQYKEAFADDELWKVLGNKLQDLLGKSWQDRSEEEGLIIERILILVRNILHIPPDPDVEKCTDNGISVHDKVVWTMRYAEITDLLMYIVSSDDEESYYIYVLEILSLYLREQKPEDLANAAPQRSETEKHKDEAELLAIRHKESTQKTERIRKFAGARHSRFGGTFVVRNLKSINDENELIYHKPLNRLDALDFDVDKDRKRTPKNRCPVRDANISRKTIFAIRLFLKDFCIEFLKAGYNKLMHHTAMRLERAKSAMHDETYYLWTMRFFMEFNRLYKFDIKLVSETMSQRTFHKVLQQMEHNYDMMASDKKKIDLWSKRLHLALKAYRELLLTLMAMDKSPDENVCQSANIIKSNIFYQIEYRDCLYQFLVHYSPIKCSFEYLTDLLETQHIFLKMLQFYCKDNRSIVVQKKQKVKSKKQKKKQVVTQPEVEPELSLEDQWDQVAPELTTVLEVGENIPTDVVPFDASSDVPIDDQKADAMFRIQKYLRTKEFETAIGLLRAAREVWPENDAFGSSSMAPEEEFLAMREIFFAQLSNEEEKTQKSAAAVLQHEEEEEEYEEDEEDEMVNAMENLSETDFQFDDFVKRLAHPKIVEACGMVLRNFDKNSTNTNHCVLKLLHRIAFDCKMYVLVFQASIFRTFQRIFAEKNLPQNKELVKFATYIIRQFVRVAEKNKKVFMELLFWKNSKDAYEIEEGYGTYKQRSQAAKQAWTEAEEEELRMLAVEYRQKEIQEDAIDWIQENLVNNTRTRRGIMKKLKELMLMTDYRPLKKSSGTGSSRPPKEWQDDEIEQLTELYEQFKDENDPLSEILGRLSVKRPKNRVVDKLLQLGLVQDKKELRKKRSSKSQANRIQGRNVWASEDELLPTTSDSSDDENRTSNRNQNSPKRNKKLSKKSSSKKNTKKSGPASTATIAKSLIEVVQAGMTTSLQWIHESLTEAADDLEQETDPSEDGVPLVPIAEVDVQAMDEQHFQKMLLNIGICKPADEQESYWRIPSTLSVAELRRISVIITSALEGTLTVPEEKEPVQENDEANQNEQSSDEEDEIFNKLRKFVKEDADENEEIPKPKARKSKPRKKNLGQKDTEPLDNDLVEQETGETISKILTSSKKNQKKKRKIVTASDSDEDNGSQNSDNQTSAMENEKSLKNILDSSDSSENEEKEKNGSPKKKSKTLKNVLSDSDSDLDDSKIVSQNSDITNSQNSQTSQNSKKSTQKKKKKSLKNILSDSESDRELSITQNSQKSNLTSSQNSQKSDLTSTQNSTQKSVLTGSQNSQKSDLTSSQNSQKSDLISTQNSIQKSVLTGSQNSQKSDLTSSQNSQKSDLTSSQNSQKSDLTSSQNSQKKKRSLKNVLSDSDSDLDITLTTQNSRKSTESSQNSNLTTTQESHQSQSATKKKKKLSKSISSDSDSDSDLDKTVTQNSQKRTRKTFSDSDSEKSENETRPQNTQSTISGRSSPKSSESAVSSQENGKSDIENGFHSEDNEDLRKKNTFTKKLVDSESGSESNEERKENSSPVHEENSKRSRESDSESDHNQSQNKKKRVLISDDED